MDFFQHFQVKLIFFFHKHFPNYIDSIYLQWFLSYLEDNLHERSIFGHLYWCMRNSNDPYSCKICCNVTKCSIFDYSENSTVGIYGLCSYKRWDEDFAKIFEDDEYYTIRQNMCFKNCPPRYAIYSYNQLLNYFGKISIRIFLNTGKNYFFFGKYKQRFVYQEYLNHTKKLWRNIISATRKVYIKEALNRLMPYRDYDATYLIICNSCYIQYLKSKEKCK